MPENHHIGEYEIIDLIDKGAQGSIYRARYTGAPRPGLETDQIVALKRMVEEDQYFDRQANFDTELAHPNIVAYLDHFREEGFEERPCIVMEYLEGMTLEEAIELYVARGGLAWDKVKNLFLQCIDGFMFAYDKGIIHRDVKPSNIFICDSGEVKLIDFGVSRRMDGQTTMGGFRGTLDYMSPDFVTNEGFTGDEQSDIYSLGVCFFEALTGLLPYSKLGASAEFEFMARWADDGQPVFSLGSWYRQHKRRKRINANKLEHSRLILHGLSQFIKRSLSGDRGKRFQNFAQMHSALKKIDYVKIQSPQHHYEFIDVLGQGGFGRVYKARLVTDHQQFYAIKELLNAKNAARFEREAKLMQQFPHPNIVAATELFEHTTSGEQRLYLAMEYLPGMPGSSLRDRIKAHLKESKTTGALEAAEVLVLLDHYLEGLENLHKNGVLHRDIKPANLYAPDGSAEQAKLLDLGIARDAASTMTKAGAPGTLDYMAPEFATRSDFKGAPSSDVYSLGLTMYEAAVGAPALPKLNTFTEPIEVAFYKRATQPPEIKFDHAIFQEHPALCAILKKATQPNVSRRYASAREMQEDVRKAIAGGGIDPDSVTLFTPETRMLRSEMETVALQDAEKLFGQLPSRARNAPPLTPRSAPGATPGFIPPEPAVAPLPQSRASRSHSHSQAIAQSSLNIQRPGRSRAAAIFTWLFVIALLGGAGTGYFFYRPQVDAWVGSLLNRGNACADIEQRVHTNLNAISQQTVVDRAMIEAFVGIQQDVNRGNTQCPDIAWDLLVVEINKHAHTTPTRLLQQIKRASERGDPAAAERDRALLVDLQTKYGNPKNWGTRVEDIQALVTQADPLLIAAREKLGELSGQQRANDALAAQLQAALQEAADDPAALSRHLGQVALMDTNALSTAKQQALRTSMLAASQTIEQYVQLQQSEISARYQAKLCEKAEDQYQALLAYLGDLPQAAFASLISNTQRALSDDRAQCQAYVNTYASYREKITPLLQAEVWQLTNLDACIGNISELVAAAKLANSKNLQIDADQTLLHQRLGELVSSAAPLQNSTRQSVLLKLEILCSTLTRRQSDLANILNPTQLALHTQAVEQQLSSYLLRVTNQNPHALDLSLAEGEALPMLAAEQSTIIRVPISKKTANAERQLTARSPGYEPITRTFLPTRGGYGEIAIGGMAEFRFAAPTRTAEQAIAQYREHLFQVSSFAGSLHANQSLRRFEDLNLPPAQLSLALPNIPANTDLPAEYNLRLQRILLWNQLSGTELATKLKTLSTRATGALREQLLIDVFILLNQRRKTAEVQQLSDANTALLDRVMAHNQFLYPGATRENAERILRYLIDHPDDSNQYDYLLAIHATYRDLHDRALGKPRPAIEALSRAQGEPLQRIRTENTLRANQLKQCLSFVNAIRAGEITAGLEQMSDNPLEILVLVDQVTNTGHPLKIAIARSLKKHPADAIARIKKKYQAWNVTAP